MKNNIEFKIERIDNGYILHYTLSIGLSFNKYFCTKKELFENIQKIIVREWGFL